MKEITFPDFNLVFNIDNIAIDIGGISIYWYAILIVSAFIIGIIFCKNDDGKYSVKFDDILELMIMLIPISVISARIYFVLFKLNYYIQNPIEIFDIRNGGLAIYGGIVGAIIVILAFCKAKKINTLDMLDYIVPYLALRSINWKMGELF